MTLLQSRLAADVLGCLYDQLTMSSPDSEHSRLRLHRRCRDVVRCVAMSCAKRVKLAHARCDDVMTSRMQTSRLLPRGENQSTAMNTVGRMRTDLSFISQKPP